jgi:DNA-binding transcriptional LysR family regulator
MELRSLRAFVEVARSGGFTAAAERLSLTQSGVSKLVRRLEDELGVGLLKRTTRRIVLTDAGRIVMTHAEEILQRTQGIANELTELKGLVRGELRIGVPTLGPRLMVPLIGEYRRRYPGVELRFFEEGSRAIESALLEGRLELGGLLAPVDTTRFEHRMLIDDRLALLAPSASRWAGRTTVRLKDLADEPLLLFLSSYKLNERILEACRATGFTPTIAGRSGQLGFIRELVRSRVGVALLPRSELVGVDPKDCVVAELREPVIPWRIDLVWARGGYLSPAARRWLDLMAETTRAAGRAR